MTMALFYQVYPVSISSYWLPECRGFEPHIEHNSLDNSDGVIFRQWSSRPGFNPRSSHIKDSKTALDSSVLNSQHYKVRIKGEWSNPGKGVVPSPTFGIVAIEKGALGSSSTMVGQLDIYMYTLG